MPSPGLPLRLRWRLIGGQSDEEGNRVADVAIDIAETDGEQDSDAAADGELRKAWINFWRGDNE